PVEFFEHGDQGRARGVLCGVFGQGEAVLAGDDDSGFVEQPDLHGIVGLVEGQAEDVEAAYEVGDGGGRLYGNFHLEMMSFEWSNGIFDFFIAVLVYGT